MNERIRELYDQALESKFNYGAGAGVKPGEYYSNYITVLNPEKFAELIVAECVNVLDPNGEYTAKYKHSHTPGPDGLRTVLSHEHFYEMMAANKLKKHFGVKE